MLKTHANMTATEKIRAFYPPYYAGRQAKLRLIHLHHVLQGKYGRLQIWQRKEFEALKQSAIEEIRICEQYLADLKEKNR